MENVLTATNHHNTLAAHSIVNVDIKQEKEESIDAINCKPDPIVLAEKSHENGHIGLNEVTKNEPNYVNDEHLKDVDAKLDQSNQVKEEDDDDESGGKEVEEDIEDEDVPQSCEQFFDFAVICSFFQQFGAQLGFTYSIETLKGLLEETKVSNDLIELHVKLLRKLKKYVNKDRWESGLVKFVLHYSHVDAWEIERFGYQNLKLQTRLQILKRLLDAQFDFNGKFKTEINNIETLLLRLVPIGRDLNGNQYWYHLDEEHTLRIYREQPDLERSWSLICENKDQFLELIANVEQENTLVTKIEAEKITNSEESKVGVESEKEEEEEADLENPEDTKESNKTTVLNESSSPIAINGQLPRELSFFKPVKKEQELRTESSIMVKDDNQEDQENIEIVRNLLRELVDKTVQDCETSCPESFRVNQPLVISTIITSTKLDVTENTVKKRGRKRKGLLAELDIIEPPPVDTTPVKRSSRIQALQEKRNAELKAQMEMEQRRLAEKARMDEIRKQKKAEEDSSALQQFLKEQEDSPDEDEEDEESEEEDKKRKRRKRKGNRSSDSEFEVSQIKVEKRSKGKKGRKKKQTKTKSKQKITWSSNEEHDDDEEHEDDFDDHIDEEEEVLKFEDNPDEFACEEIDPDEEPVILKRARTAKKTKQENEAEEEIIVNDDTPCQKCALYTDPEWILLCDNCDLGYHTHCLAPPLYLIPEGDWYCPKCENKQLLEKLRFEFDHYVSNLAKREREQLRKERLKYVAINIGNIIQEDTSNRIAKKSKAPRRDYDSNDDEDDNDEEDDGEDDEENGSESDISSGQRREESRPRKVSKPKSKSQRRTYYSDESDAASGTSDEDESDNDDEANRVRSARKRVSYQFKEYDDLINKAIQGSDYDAYEDEDLEDEEDEEEATEDYGKSPFSKGKDISNLAKMDKGDLFGDSKLEVTAFEKETDTNFKVSSSIAAEQVEPAIPNERPASAAKSGSGKRKSKRKLNDLDSPDDDPEEDSDFSLNASSQTELEDEDETEENADDSNASDEDEESDLSDWQRSSKRSGRTKPAKKTRSKRRSKYGSSDEYDDDDDSDYCNRSKRSRVSKRVSYREVSSTEEDDEDDSYSDSSLKSKAKKKSKGGSGKKSKAKEDDEFTASETDFEEEYEIPSRKSNRRASDDNFVDDDDSDEEVADDSDEDERRVLPKQKSNEKKKTKNNKKTPVPVPKKLAKRNVKKKVYEDYTDGEQTEDSMSNESDQEYRARSVKKTPAKVTQAKRTKGSAEIVDKDDQTPVSQAVEQEPPVSIKMSLRQKRTYSKLADTSMTTAPKETVTLDKERAISADLIQVKDRPQPAEQPASQSSDKESPLEALTAFAMPMESNPPITTQSLVPNSASFNAHPNPPPVDKSTTLHYPPQFIVHNGQPDLMNNPALHPSMPHLPYSHASPLQPSPHTVMSSFSPTKSVQPASNGVGPPSVSVAQVRTGILSSPHVQPHQPHAPPPISAPHTLPPQPPIDLPPPHLSGLPPHLASQLASQHQQQLASHLAGGFSPITSYPPHFYDPAFAYFGHPVPHGPPPHPAVSAAAAYHHSQMVASSYHHAHHPGYAHPTPHPSLQPPPHMATLHPQPPLPPNPGQIHPHSHPVSIAHHLPPSSSAPSSTAASASTSSAHHLPSVSPNTSKLPNAQR